MHNNNNPSTFDQYIEAVLALLGAVIAAYVCFPYSKDGEAYKYIYENIFDITEIEYLFKCVFQAGLMIGISIEVVLLLLIFLALILKLKAFNKLGDSSVYMYAFYISFFFLLHDGSQYRISVALAFALWSCIAILRRQWKRSILLGVLTFGFHISAVLLPLVFFCCYYSEKFRKLSWLFFITGFFVYLLNIPINELLTTQITFLLGGRYIGYTSDIINEQNTSGLAFVYGLLFSILLLYIHYLGKFKFKKLPKIFHPLLAVNIIGCGILFWLYETVAVASRLSDVLMILIIPLLGVVIRRLPLLFRGFSVILLSMFFYIRLLQLFLY